MADIADIADEFKIPIYYNELKQCVDPNIITELELIQSLCSSEYKEMYQYLWGTGTDDTNTFNIDKQIASYYTSDVQYLEDTQHIIQNINLEYFDISSSSSSSSSMCDVWNTIKGISFIEECGYIGTPHEQLKSISEFLNSCSMFLHVRSLYQLLSPLIVIILPLLLIILPYIVIRFMRYNMSFESYMYSLKNIIGGTPIYKLVTSVCKTDIKTCTQSAEQMTLIATILYYLFSIYQSYVTFVNFNETMCKFHKYAATLRQYISSSIINAHSLLLLIEKYPTYDAFSVPLRFHMKQLEYISCKLSCISSYTLLNSCNKLFEFGHIYTTFYELHSSETLNKTIMYSFGCNQYVKYLCGIKININDGKIGLATFTNEKNKMQINQSSYPCLSNTEQNVPQNIKLDTNIVLSGPNASGKTTIVKQTFINTLISLQIGYGFYASAVIYPFTHLHCYINIPDTAGRDSLFEAEARQCKTIIDSINNGNTDTHFCIFDELYSGTNPYEAVKYGVAFMKFMSNNPNVTCMLTTHYTKLCKRLQKCNNCTNYKMVVETEPEYKCTYKMRKGISKILGGINVLRKLDYPCDISGDPPLLGS